jgi:hypothetical protein
MSVNKTREKYGPGKFMNRRSEFLTEIIESADSPDETIFNCNGSAFDSGAVDWQ